MLEVTSGQELLGIYAQQQEAETPPALPGMEQHKKSCVAMLDIQRRKFDDVVTTGGANLERIIAEEESLAQAAKDQLQGYRDARKAWDLPNADH